MDVLIGFSAEAPFREGRVYLLNISAYGILLYLAGHRQERIRMRQRLEYWLDRVFTRYSCLLKMDIESRTYLSAGRKG